jgi:hypothetical protein
VDNSGPTKAIGSRALECAIIAILVLLAADTVRSDLGPLWQALSLLFGV